MSIEMNRVLGLAAVNVGGEVAARAAATSLHENFFLHDALTIFQIVAAIITALYVAVKIGQNHERHRKERLIQLCPLNRLPADEILTRLAEPPPNGRHKLLEDCPICKMSEAELARVVKFSKTVEE